MQPTNARIIQLILAIAKKEKSIETIRQVLAKQCEFEPYAAFLRIDRGCHGYLTTSSLMSFLLYYF